MFGHELESNDHGGFKMKRKTVRVSMKDNSHFISKLVAKKRGKRFV